MSQSDVIFEEPGAAIIPYLGSMVSPLNKVSPSFSILLNSDITMYFLIRSNRINKFFNRTLFVCE